MSGCVLQLGFLCVAYPSLVITYLGQAAYLMVNPDNYSTTFYACIPSPVYWPVFVVAVLAAIVASQVRRGSISRGIHDCNMHTDQASGYLRVHTQLGKWD